MNNSSTQSRQAVLCFLIRDDEILLALSELRPDKLLWNGISGYIEGTETPEDAAIRTFYREIKARVYAHDLEKSGVMHLYALRDDTFREETLTLTIFLCERWQGEPTYTPGVKPRWFQIDSIPYEDMFEDTKAWLPRILDGEQLIIEIISHINPDTHQNEVKDVLVRGVFS